MTKKTKIYLKNIPFSGGGHAFMPEIGGYGERLLDLAHDRAIKMPEWLRVDLSEAGIAISAIENPIGMADIFIEAANNRVIDDSSVAQNNQTLLNMMENLSKHLDEAIKQLNQRINQAPQPE